MKNSIVFLSLIAISLLWECTCEPSNSIEGVWEAQYLEWSNADTTFIFEKSDTKGQIKTFTKGYFSFVNQNPDMDTTGRHIISGGSGIYTLLGDTLTEKMLLSPWPGMRGKPLSYQVKISNDTLFQIFPYPGCTAETWKEWTGKEIYIRIE